MGNNNDIREALKASKSIKKLKNKIIFYIIIIAAVLALCILGFFLISSNIDNIHSQYKSLSGKPTDSRHDFNKYYNKIVVINDTTGELEITVDKNGNNVGINGPSVNGEINQPGGESGGNEQPPEDLNWESKINGDTLIFPEVGESLNYREINTNKTGQAVRADDDLLTFEFSLGYVSTSDSYKTMKSRAQKLINSGSLINQGSDSPLRIKLDSSTEAIVGCSPIVGFGQLGDIIKFDFNNGESINILVVDFKSNWDNTGSGASKQCNTEYCHGSINDGYDTIKLSAIEVWTGGNNTRDGNFNGIPDSTVKQATIIGHSNIFD